MAAMLMNRIRSGYKSLRVPGLQSSAVIAPQPSFFNSSGLRNKPLLCADPLIPKTKTFFSTEARPSSNKFDGSSSFSPKENWIAMGNGFKGFQSTFSSRKQDEQQRRHFSEAKSSPKSPISWRSVFFTFVLGSIFVAYFIMEDRKKMKKIREETNKSFGIPKIGGPFSLVNHFGFPVTNLDYRGSFLLVYFGFTHCPDICPTELTNMTDIMRALEKEGLDQLIQPLFITIDPYRDTVASVREYVKDFHPHLIGLTGTPAQVEKVCKSFRVYFSKANEESDDDYLVDHSIILYLMDTNGKFLDFFGTNLEKKDIIGKIKEHLNTYLKEQKKQGSKEQAS